MKIKEIEFDLSGHEYIELKNLLKVSGLCETGAHAKHVVDEGQVLVDGEIETRKSCKLVAGQVVVYSNHSIKIV